MVICLERGVDLHVAQLMPLQLTASCFSKIQIGFTFLYRLTWVVPEKGPLNVLVGGAACASVVGRINEVTVRRARLVLRWVNVFGRVYNLGMQAANLVNSALHPSGVAKLSTSLKKVKFSHTRYRALGPELIPVYKQSARR